MLTRLTSHFGGGGKTPGASSSKNEDYRLENNSSFAALPSVTRETSPFDKMRQDTATQYYNHSGLSNQLQNQRLLHPKVQAGLMRDNSEPRLVMPDIYVSPNQSQLRKQSATLTDNNLPFLPRDRKRSQAGSIFSLRDQVKVCTIINKRFKKVIQRQVKKVSVDEAANNQQQPQKKKVEERRSSVEKDKENQRNLQHQSSRVPQSERKFNTERRSQEHYDRADARGAILEIGSQAVDYDVRNQNGLQTTKASGQHPAIGFEPEQLLSERLQASGRTPSRGQKMFKTPTGAVPNKLASNSTNVSTNQFNSKARATSMIQPSAGESQFNADVYYQTNKDRGAEGGPSRFKIGGANQFNESIAGMTVRMPGGAGGFAETMTSAGLMNKLSDGGLTTRQRGTPDRKVMKKVPSRRDFIRTIEGTNSVNELVSEVKNRFALKKAVKEDNESKRMVGKTGTFQLPDETFYKRNLSKMNGIENKNYVEKISNNVVHMQGMIYVNDYYAQQKNKQLAKLDPVKDYVSQFSAVHEVVDQAEEDSNVFGFAKALQEKMQKNQVNITLKNHLFSKMTSIKASRQVAQGELTEEEATKEKQDCKWEATMFDRTLEEETKTISNIARNFVRKQEYEAKFKKRELSTDRHGQQYDLDPRIKYFKQCLQEQDLVLPILDKIYKKTLCLNDYNLSDGNCRGLAAACQLFDHTVVNRVLFNNCGITGDQFAMILEGLHKLKDFKSIIYKMNTLNAVSLAKLVPVFEMRLPNHLEELKIIDCKINATLLSQLMTSLLEKSQLRSLAIVNVYHSPESFELVTKYVEQSEYLRDIDLSWNIILPSYWCTFMETISKNRTLSSLTLAFCQILEDQDYKVPFDDKWQGVEEVELSEWNMYVMDMFRDFIKYNPNLIHLDLQNTGLMVPAIKQFGDLLTRAQSLKCLHLSGNDGVTEDTVKWLQHRIRGKPPRIPNNIILYKKMEQGKAKRDEVDPVAATGQQEGEEDKKQDVLELFGAKKSNNQESNKFKFKPVDPKAQWKDIRNGLKLRNIVQSKRMNELGLKSGIKETRLVLQRHLGYKEMIPGAGQWELLTNRKDECWLCGQHILTLFIWTPRIGQLTASKDQKVIKHYRDQMEALQADEDFLPTFYTTPRIASDFNGWHYKDMREIIPFCEDNDDQKPDFLDMCLVERLVTQKDLHFAEFKEKKKLKVDQIVEERQKKYYKDSWQKIIMRIMRYRNPLVANAHMLTNITNQIDPNQKIYFHIDWVRPGRHVFLIQHDNDEIRVGDGAEEEKKAPPTSISALFGLKKMQPTAPEPPKLKKSTNNFYVHEMLATFRQDPIPPYFKERHLEQTAKNMHRGKIIFKQVTLDVLENMRVSMEKDMGWIELGEITNNDKAEQKVLLKHAQINYEMISETYHWLQSRSKLYPWIDDYTFRETFIKQLNVLDARVFNMSKFEVLMAQCKFSNRFEEKIDKRFVDPPKGICRFMFVELLFRISKFLYSSSESATQNQVYEMSLGQNAQNETVKVSQAFYMFVKEKLLPFYKTHKITQHAFRNDFLHQADVEIVYTMNEQYLRRIYTQKALEGRDTKLKPHNADWMILQDCYTLFRDDLPLKLPYKMINEAFGMSQIHIINEFDKNSLQEYNKLSYVEFLEFLARIAELYFEESEMEELDLHVKIEYLLDEILPLVHAKRVKQQTVIEEFSESDDDY